MLLKNPGEYLDTKFWTIDCYWAVQNEVVMFVILGQTSNAVYELAETVPRIREPGFV